MSTIQRTLEVPGASLYYEIRGSGPVLMLIALPGDSAGFASIAPLLASDYTVVSYDPRGISRSTIDDSSQDAHPDLIADDVHRLLTVVSTEPAYVFGSSGGAITGLALATAHPGQIRTLVAHEPPLVEFLPDREQMLAAIDEVYDTYCTQGPAAAWPKFFAAAGFHPPAAADGAGDEPRPQELPTAQMVANGNRFLAHCLRPVTRYRPNIAALRATPARIVVGRGTSSTGQLAHRTATALASELGTTPVEFPGDHIGFASEPDRFVDVLRRVLTN